MLWHQYTALAETSPENAHCMVVRCSKHTIRCNNRNRNRLYAPDENVYPWKVELSKQGGMDDRQCHGDSAASDTPPAMASASALFLCRRSNYTYSEESVVPASWGGRSANRS